MKLIIAIVQNSDSNRLINALKRENFQSTKLASSGGFLKEGNTTLMIGSKAEELDEILYIIETQCSERATEISRDYPMRANLGFSSPTPIEIEAGGAIVFVLPTESFLRL